MLSFKRNSSGKHQGLEKRRHGRLECEEIPCSVGYIVDMSASGMRLRVSKDSPLTEGEETSVTIEHDSGLLSVPVRVEWMEKLNKREFKVGVAFRETSPDLRRKLFMAGQGMPSMAREGRPEGC